MKFRVFWDIAPCSHVEVDRRFRGAHCLQHRPDDGASTCFRLEHSEHFPTTIITISRQLSSHLGSNKPQIRLRNLFSLNSVVSSNGSTYITRNEDCFIRRLSHGPSRAIKYVVATKPYNGWERERERQTSAWVCNNIFVQRLAIMEGATDLHVANISWFTTKQSWSLTWEVVDLNYCKKRNESFNWRNGSEAKIISTHSTEPQARLQTVIGYRNTQL
jgi:hypothetical protein